MKKLRRTLYLGLGGTGIKVIDEVKKQITGIHGEVPPMIKFLGIDADRNSIGLSSLNLSEQLVLSETNAHLRFIAHRNSEQYIDFPIKNADYLSGISGNGTGIVRSNASFLFMTHSCEIEREIRCWYDALCSVCASLSSAKYAIHETSQIDVHICLSLCGGFGSGSFLEISKLVKKIIPNSNIIVYAFSHDFFSYDFSLNRHLKSNCYASLLEADYLINKNLSTDRYDCPFDKFFYLDNDTYSFSQSCYSFRYCLQDVIKNIAEAMVKIGDVMADYGILLEHCLIPEYRKGVHDVVLDTNKKAWVSSIGYACFEAEEYTSIVEYIETIPEEELDHKICQMVSKAAPLMDINSFGYILHISQINYLILSKDAECIEQKLQASFERIGISTYDLHNMPVIYTDKKDQIAFYREIHSIQPYFIKGISKGINGVSECYSCESEFNRVIESGRYSPFSRQSYEDAVKNGFSLRSSRVTE